MIVWIPDLCLPLYLDGCSMLAFSLDAASVCEVFNWLKKVALYLGNNVLYSIMRHQIVFIFHK